jgi:uncharacterized protein (TIGR03382 family)
VIRHLVSIVAGFVVVSAGPAFAQEEAPPAIVAVCAWFEECLPDAAESVCTEENARAFRVSAAVGHPDCDELNTLYLAWCECVAALTCAESEVAENEIHPCFEASVAFESQHTQVGEACVSGRVPPPPPDGWNCPRRYYDTLDGCDCGCGIPDPDCRDSGVGTPGQGVGVEGCSYCHDANGEPLPGDAQDCILGNTQDPSDDGDDDGDGDDDSDIDDAAAGGARTDAGNDESSSNGGAGSNIPSDTFADTGRGEGCASTSMSFSPALVWVGVGMLLVRRRRRR